MSLFDSVFFGDDENKIREQFMLSDFVMLTKSDNNWDDYGNKAFFNLTICKCNSDSETFYDAIKIIFDKKNSAGFYFGGENNENIPAGEVTFLSQVQSEKIYRKILNVFDGGKAETIGLLIGIRDAATLREISDSSEISLLNDEDLYDVLLRSSDASYAFSKGVYLILKGDEGFFETSEVFDRPFSFNVEGGIGSYKLTLDFSKDKYFPTNVNLLVGPNGSGKSYTLSQLVNIIYGGGFDSRKSLRDYVPIFNRVVVLSNTINDDFISTKLAAKKLLPNVEYHYSNLITQKKFDMQFGVRKRYTTTRALQDILWRDWSERGGDLKFEMLMELLKEVIQFDSLKVPMVGNVYSELGLPFDGERRIRYLNDFDKKKELSFFKGGEVVGLSSGQNYFIRMVFNVLALVEQNSLVIFDEPENFLHPNYEIDFVRIFNMLLSETKSVGLVATHSSVIVREIPEKNVNIFIRNDDGVFISKPKIETFGNSLNKISNYIFGDIAVEKEYSKHIKNMISNDDDVNSVIEKYSDDLDPDMLSLILNSVVDKSYGKTE